MHAPRALALVVLSLSLTAPALAAPARTRISPGVSAMGLAEPGSLGGAAQLGLSYQLTRWLEPEIVVGLGGTAGGNTDYFNRFSFGLRLEAPLETFSPYAWVAFAHVHEAPVSALLENPLGVVFAASPAIVHRSGGEVGLGFTVPVKTLPTEDSPVVELGVRVSAIYLPGFATMVMAGPKRGDALYGQLELTLGLPFDLSPLRGEID